MIELLLDACSQVIVPEASEEAMRFYRSGNILWMISQGWSLLVPLFLLFSGWSGKLGKIAKHWGKRWFFTIAIYLVLFILLYQAFDFPLDFYASYVRMHSYGLSDQTLYRWFENFGKSLLVVLIGALCFIWIFYWLLKKSPRRWWFYSSLVSTAITFFLMFIQPIWIAPLFNHFGPMQNKELEEQILALANRAGIQDGRVFEVDKSQDTNLLNAYVAGLGSTKRIVLWNTTVEKLSPDEILFVMGHEMGHYVLHHVWWGLVYYGSVSFLIFYLTYRSANKLLHRYHKRFGFKQLSDIASLPLLMALITAFSFLVSPLSNFYSRLIEHEADRFGLEITQNNEAAGQAFVALQQQNLANPRPGLLYKFWRSTHPPLGERVDFTNSYCPWNQGEPLKYEKYFSEM